jgi:hypothetical protein
VNEIYYVLRMMTNRWLLSINLLKICIRKFGNSIFIYRQFYFVTGEFVTGSTAWLGRGLSCVCAQRRESDARPSFDLTPTQVIYFVTLWSSYRLTNLNYYVIYDFFFLLKHLFNYMHIEYTFILKTDLSSHQITTNVVQYSFHHDINVSLVGLYLCILILARLGGYLRSK